MKRLLPYLLLALPMVALAHRDGAVLPDGVVYEGGAQMGPLGQWMFLLEDTSGTMPLSEVLASDAFQATTEVVPNLGVKASTYWVKLKVYNASAQDPPVLLFDYPEVEQFTVFVVSNGKLTHRVQGGERSFSGPSEQKSPLFSYDLPIPYGSSAEIYIRVWSDKQLQLPIFLVSPRFATVLQLRRSMIMGGYIGIMLVMALYNLFILASIRERYYIFYILYLVSVCLTQLSLMGYTAFYLWPGNAWLIKHSSVILTVATMILAAGFMQRFINVQAHVPRFLLAKWTIYAVAIAGVLINCFGSNTLGYQVVQATSAVMATYMLYIAAKIARTGHRHAQYFLVAWCVFTAGIVVFVAKDWGFLPHNDFTNHMMAIGSSIEVVLISFGLADRINVLRAEKEQSQAHAIQAAKEMERVVRNQNQLLEQKVAERTQELQRSNDHLKRTQSQLVNAEKMASLGQLTAGIAHELNNPLNFISNNIPPLRRDLEELKKVLQGYRESVKGTTAMEQMEQMEQQLDTEMNIREVEAILRSIEQGASRTSEIVRGLRTFSRLDEEDLKLADINKCLRSTLVVLGPQFRDVVKVTYDLASMPKVECFPGKLNQVFMNLLNNAAHAVMKRHGTQGGHVSISTRLSEGLVEVIIADNGIGIEESIRERLFEPFFTTKEVGEGTGLGLSIVQGIIDKHNGTIEVESKVGQGTTFTITIPASQYTVQAKRAS